MERRWSRNKFSSLGSAHIPAAMWGDRSLCCVHVASITYDSGLTCAGERGPGDLTGPAAGSQQSACRGCRSSAEQDRIYGAARLIPHAADLPATRPRCRSGRRLSRCNLLPCAVCVCSMECVVMGNGRRVPGKTSPPVSQTKAITLIASRKPEAYLAAGSP